MTTSGVTGVIDFFTHPPLGALSLEHVPSAPLSGGLYALNRPRGPIHTDAYGILWSVSAAALGTGSTPGIVTEWDERVVEIACDYILFDGTPAIGQRIATNMDNGIMMFEQLLPFGLDVQVGVPFLVDFFWILLL